jgi:DNA-binding transcriptional ArsR family regulator
LADSASPECPAQTEAVDHAGRCMPIKSPETAPEAEVSGGPRGPAVGTTARDRVLKLIAENNGSVRADQRSLAAAIGVPRSTLARTIASLTADGIVTKRASATGTVLTLSQQVAA